MTAFLAKHYGGVVGHGLQQPVGTVTTVDHHALVTSHLAKLRGTSTSAATGAPLGTITSGGTHHAEVRAFLTAYYGSDQDTPLSDPLHTVTTKPRFGLVTVAGEPYEISDIGMRMLQPHELYAAQGFPPGYIHTWGIDATGKRVPFTKGSQVRMCGNSVCPPLSQALVAANYTEQHHAAREAA